MKSPLLKNTCKELVFIRFFILINLMLLGSINVNAQTGNLQTDIWVNKHDLVPGEKFDIKLKGKLTEARGGKIKVTYYLSSDKNLSEGDILVGTSINDIIVNRFTIHHSNVLGKEVPAGKYYLLINTEYNGRSEQWEKQSFISSNFQLAVIGEDKGDGKRRLSGDETESDVLKELRYAALSGNEKQEKENENSTSERQQLLSGQSETESDVLTSGNAQIHGSGVFGNLETGKEQTSQPDSVWVQYHKDSLQKAQKEYVAYMRGRPERMMVRPKDVAIAAPTTFNYYVSTTGSDASPGTESAPFATIQHAINTTESGSSIKVLPGTYVENLNFNGKTIKLVGSPDNPEKTIIDGGGITHVIEMSSRESNQTLVSGFVITNGLASGSYPHYCGGGIFLYDNAYPTLSNLIIRGNTAVSIGGGIAALHNGHPTLENVLMYNNTANSAAAIYLYNVSTAHLTNVTIANNNNNIGDRGAIYIRRKADLSSANSVLWNPACTYELQFSLSDSQYDSPCKADISYTDMRGGESAGVDFGVSPADATLSWGTGSFNADPAFVDLNSDDYNLQAGSPCIDAGNPDSQYNDINFPPSKGSERNDVGYTGGPSTVVEKKERNLEPSIIPQGATLLTSCSGELINTVVLGTEKLYSSYSWLKDDGDGEYDSEDTELVTSATLEVLEPGIYHVLVTDADGYEGVSSIAVEKEVQQGVDGIYYVTNSNTSGPGSLYDAITLSNNNPEDFPHSIVFCEENEPYDITLPEGNGQTGVVLSKPVVIDASNLSSRPAIQYYSYSPLVIDSDGITLRNLSFKASQEGSGGFMTSGESSNNLTIDNCLISDFLNGLYEFSGDNLKVTNCSFNSKAMDFVFDLRNCESFLIGDNINNGNHIFGLEQSGSIFYLEGSSGKISGNTIRSNMSEIFNIFQPNDVIIGGETEEEGNVLVTSNIFVQCDEEEQGEVNNIVVKNNYLGVDRALNREPVTMDVSEEELILCNFINEQSQLTLESNKIAIYSEYYSSKGSFNFKCSKNLYVGDARVTSGKYISWDDSSCPACGELRKAPEITAFELVGKKLSGTIGTRTSEYSDGDVIEIYSFDPGTYSATYISLGKLTGTTWVSEELVIPEGTTHLMANLTHGNSTSEFSVPFELPACANITPVIAPQDAVIIASPCTGQVLNAPTLSLESAYTTYKWLKDDGDGEYGSEDTELASTATLEVSEPGTYHILVTDADGCEGVSSIEIQKVNENGVNGIYFVTSTENEGEGSLRAAMEASNANSENLPHKILFCESLSGQTLQITSLLPIITQPVTIDGSALAQKPVLILDLLDPSEHYPVSDVSSGMFLVQTDNTSFIGIELRNTSKTRGAIEYHKALGAQIERGLLKNLDISGWNTGVELAVVNNFTLEGINIEECSYGIRLWGASNGQIGSDQGAVKIRNSEMRGIYFSGARNINVHYTEITNQNQSFTNEDEYPCGLYIEGSSGLDIGSDKLDEGLVLAGLRYGVYVFSYMGEMDNIHFKNNMFGIEKDGTRRENKTDIYVESLYEDIGLFTQNNTFYRQSQTPSIINTDNTCHFSQEKFVYSSWAENIKPIDLAGYGNDNKQAPVITEYNTELSTISGTCDIGNTAYQNDEVEVYALVPGVSTEVRIEYLFTARVAADGSWITENLELPEGTTHVMATISDYNGKNAPYESNTSEFSAPFEVVFCEEIYGVPCSEVEALTALYNSTRENGPWKDETNWLTETHVTNWYGVNAPDGHVREIYLQENNLKGTFPAELENLTELTHLYLHSNEIRGEIPEELGNCQKLLYLHLYQNKLSGSIPLSLSSIPALYYLQLGNNELTGTVPDGFWEHSKLAYLYIYNNKLEDQLPENINMMKNLRVLHLWGNEFFGTLPPQIAELDKMHYLQVGGNNFEGSIKPAVDIPNLKYLYVNENNFSGDIPTELWSKTELVELFIRNNPFNEWTLPSGIGDFSKLTHFVANGTNLTGALPDRFGELSSLKLLYLHDNTLDYIPSTVKKLDKIGWLYLRNNNLSFDDMIYFNEHLELFSYSPQAKVGEAKTETVQEGDPYTINLGIDEGLSSNIYRWYKDGKEIKDIPRWYEDGKEIEDIPNTNKLVLESITEDDRGTYTCKITNSLLPGLTLESLPVTIIVDGANSQCIAEYGVTCKEYEALQAFYTNLGGENWTYPEGAIPWFDAENKNVSSWSGIKVLNEHLDQIDLRSHNLVGEIPAEIAYLKWMTHLTLHDNQISGSIPPEIGQCVSLIYIHLYNNLISGKIPEELTELKNLYHLYLAENNLVGPLPDKLWEMSSLQYLILFNNDFTGESIPESIAKLTKLKYLHLQNCGMVGELPEALWGLEDMLYLMLSTNKFTGSISEFTKLKKLRNVKFQLNQFSGEIPQDIGTLQDLNYLYLHNNNFTGPVPESIWTLGNLLQLYLGYNNFDPWEIPSEVGNLTKLQRIYAPNCNLKGELPTEIGELTSLNGLWLFRNYDFNEIPEEIGNISTLEYLITNNAALTFEDLLRVGNVKNFDFNAQLKVGAKTTVDIAMMDSYTIDLDIDHGVDDNIYEWSHKTAGKVVGTTNSNQHTVVATSSEKAGVYNAVVTNERDERFANFSLTSYDYTINIHCPELTGINGPTYACIQQDLQFSARGLYLSPNQEYLWDFGNGTTSTEAEPRMEYGTSGTYTVSLTINAGDCEPVTVQHTINISVEPTAITSGGGEYCAGENAPVKFAFTGLGPWEFSFKNETSGQEWNGMQSALSDYTYNVPKTGHYRVTSVSDACYSTSFMPEDEGVDITVYKEMNSYTLMLGSKYAEVCANDELGVTLSLSGSDPGAEYQLMKNGAEFGAPLKGTNEPISWEGIMETGNYTVRAKLSDVACYKQMEGSQFITVHPPVSATLSEAKPICEGESGELVFNLSGTPPFELVLESNLDGEGEERHKFSQLYDGATFEVTQQGTYQIVSVEDKYVCTASNMGDGVWLEVHPLPDAGFTGLEVKPSYCINDEPIQLAANDKELKGSYSGYYALLDRRDGTAELAFSSTLKGTNTVTYTVSDAHCTAKTTQTFDVFGSPVEWNDWPEDVCKQGSAYELSGLATPAGGTFYNEGGEVITAINPVDKETGSHTFTYKTQPDNGCITTSENTTTFHAIPEAGIASSEELPTCAYTPLILSPVINSNPAGSSLDYYWTVSGEFVSANRDVQLRPSETVAYNLNITDKFGCTGGSSINIDVNPLPDVNIRHTRATTCPDSKDGEVGFDVSGAAAPYSYIVHSERLVGTLTESQRVDLATLLEGQHNIIATDSKGCSRNKSFTIEDGGPVIEFCAVTTICNAFPGDNISIPFNVKVSRKLPTPDGVYNYIIKDAEDKVIYSNGTGYFEDPEVHQTPELSIVVGESYFLELVKDDVNTCSVNPVEAVVSSSLLKTTISGVNTYFQCSEDQEFTVNLEAGVDKGKNCGTIEMDIQQRLLFVDQDGSRTEINGWQDIRKDEEEGFKYSYTVNKKGTYIAQVQVPEQGCMSEAYFYVKEAPGIELTVAVQDAKCDGEKGSARVIARNTVGGVSYKWMDLAAGTEIGTQSFIKDLEPNGRYKIEVADENGCSADASTDDGDFSIKGVEPLGITADGITEAAPCKLQVQPIGGTPGYDVKWIFVSKHQVKFLSLITKEVINKRVIYSDRTGENVPSEAKGLPLGDYIVEVTDANGCKYTMPDNEVFEHNSGAERTYNLSFRWEVPVPEKKETQPEKPVYKSVGPRIVEEEKLACVEKLIKANVENLSSMCKTPDRLEDELSVSYDNVAHHFTLYYYDRAGNLRKTVPPAGVKVSDSYTRGTDVKHDLETTYNYDTRGLLVQQETPDAGISEFIYNHVGQLRFSQNAQQREDGRFSYTKYDELSRIVEVGEAGFADYNGVSIGNFEDLKSQVLLALDDEDYLTTPVEDRFPVAGANQCSQRTITVYNEPGEGIDYNGEAQRYLRNRVSYSYSENTNGDLVYTYYSYDPHGNVEWLVQDIPGIGRSSLEYNYDLISGNVKQVAMNKGRADAYYHKYEYDADNRLVNVYTSKDAIIWDRDANYEYYAHGPLATMNIGNYNIQSVDYAYTVHGWLKAINTPDLNPIGNEDEGYLADAFGMELGYFNGDFKNSGSPFESVKETSLGASEASGLYNGNISWWTNKVNATGADFAFNNKLTGYRYKYDMLNRIKDADFWEFDQNEKKFADKPGYGTQYTYDGNGNLITLDRGVEEDKDMDELEYDYYPETNRLRKVSDRVLDGTHEEDFDGHPDTDNYIYDEIGNLVRDKKEGIRIRWNTYGKITEIVPDKAYEADKQKPHVKYSYDAAGNRIKKWVNSAPQYDSKRKLIEGDAGIAEPEKVEITYYLRDASGNIMSVYKRVHDKEEGETYAAKLQQVEVPIYGSGRIGTYTPLLSSYLKQTSFSAGGFNAVDFELEEKTEGHKPGISNIIAASNYEDQTFGLHNAKFNSFTEDFVTGDGKVNNIAVAEDKDGSLKFVMANITQTDNNVVSKLYNSNGAEMETAGTIDIGAESDVLALHVSGDIYYVLGTSAEGYLQYHVVDVAENKVTSVNNAVENITGYTGQFAAIEDIEFDRNVVFAAHHTPDIDPVEPGELIVKRLEVTSAGIIVSDEFKTNSYGCSHLDVSKAGEKLLVYHYADYYHIGEAYQEGELQVYNLGFNFKPESTRANITKAVGEIERGAQAVFTANPGRILLMAKNEGEEVAERLQAYDLSTDQTTDLMEGDFGDMKLSIDGNVYMSPESGGTLVQISESNEIKNIAAGENLSGNLSGKALYLHYTDNTEQLASRLVGNKQYELKDHLGNVRATVSDERLTEQPKVLTASNYYPFGMLQPNNHFSSGDYRFGFQGQEVDNEIKGNGNLINYKYRIHDPRIGRFLSIDPLANQFAYNSPYAFSMNRVIDGVELEGAEWIHYKVSSYDEESGECIVQITGEVDYGNWALNLYHTVTGHQFEYSPMHVVEAPDGRHYIFDDQMEAFTATLSDFDPETRYTKEGIDALFMVPDAVGGIMMGTMADRISKMKKPGVDLELKMKEGWSPQQRAEAAKKANALTEAETIVVKKPVRKSNTRSRFKKAGGDVKTNQDVDHTVDLQLNGADDVSNMNALDQSVNRSMGKQINNKIKDLPERTVINKVTIK